MARESSKQKLYTIYRLISPSGKCYIGFTSATLAKRWDSHWYSWNRWITGKQSGCPKLYSAFKKYSKDKWKHEVLYETSCKSAAIAAEEQYIASFNTTVCGYNSSTGGEHGALGSKRSAEAIEKSAASRRGKSVSAETRLKIGNAHRGKKRLPRGPRSQSDRDKIAAKMVIVWEERRNARS